jgi:Zn-dependent protease
MLLINLLLKDPLTFVLLIVPLLYSIIIHELAHGWVAYQMGDPTAKWAGRLTLNPLKHLDPIGTIMLFVFGFGWAKPVPVNFYNLHEQRKGLILVSAAGITANLIIAFLASLLIKILAPEPDSPLDMVLFFLQQINIILAAFNLIPIPPLDGSKILMGFVSEGLQRSLSRLEPYGFFIIIGLYAFGVLTPLIFLFRWIIQNIIAILLG